MTSPTRPMPKRFKIEPKNHEAYYRAIASCSGSGSHGASANHRSRDCSDLARRRSSPQSECLLSIVARRFRVNKRKQRSATLRCLSKRSRRTGRLAQRWAWRGLRLGRNKDALAAFRGIKATGNEPPGALAVRAAILAVNGYEEGARNDAQLLGAKPLLPEERALIAPLLQ